MCLYDTSLGLNLSFNRAAKLLQTTPNIPSNSNLAMLHRDKAQSSLVLLRRLFRGYLRPYLPGFGAAMFFMLLGAAATGQLARMIDPLVNGFANEHGMAYHMRVAGELLTIFIVGGVATYFHTVIMNQIGQRIVTNVQRQMYGHLLGADLAFFHANASGTLISRLTNDVGVMRQAMGECLTNSFKGGLTLVFLIGVMFSKDWRLSVATFIVFPVSAMFVARIGRRMRKLSASTQAETGNFAALLSQTFMGIRHVKAYGMEKAEEARVQGVTESIYSFAVRGYRQSALTSPITELMNGLAFGAAILYGGWRIDSGLLTPGALASFIAAFGFAYTPIKRMAKVNAQLQGGLAAAERVFDLLDLQATIVDAPKAVPLLTQDHTVALNDVVFSYADGTRALDHLSITIPHGKTVAIVGPSGAGKSTIINLIPRFYDVQEGCISVGGQDIRDVMMNSLRKDIGLVSQETALFDDTIRANIAYGRPEASLDEIKAAAKDAFADSFINELPQGYDTVVGEHGVKLSGGQRQRIAIARAMLRNAPILLLDEATSALDNESERAVQSALKRLQQGRTTVVVAHRLSTIVDADCIIVLDQGKVIEQGTHSELLAKRGVYARLYGMQGEFH
jgi:subfamily B ATP-binding cassette protein MsbA